MTCLPSVLNHLRTHCVVHRDIKADNIMMGDDDATVRLIDFGGALILSGKMSFLVQSPQTELWLNQRFTPPEVLVARQQCLHGNAVLDYSFSDYWSLAAVCYDILAGGVFPVPFRMQALAPLPAGVPEGLKRKLLQLLNPNLEERGRFVTAELHRI
eukprot:TRINITY_DN6783_c0_g1_i1.p2 TRINITY_DN6783_c0_g1~~TRINITY_DN6783_c0_g1_i1.p2  ORF type:complete len:156 (+),score=39.91 TRINITY_DN6783_c0_g1_i1:1085-1552(+)